MGLLQIDAGKCKRDGICVAECPTAIIKLENDGSVPTLVPGGDDFCLRCGHCVAVCPHGALSHEEVSLVDCPPIQKDLSISHEQAVQFLRSRRSVRIFKDKPVDRNLLARLIKIARYAPSASNSQLVEWIVHTDKDTIHEFAGKAVGWMKKYLEKDPLAKNFPYMPLLVAAWDAGYDAVLRNAPALIVATAPREASNGLVDVTLALSYLDLAAPTLGLGTCWAGLLQSAILSDPLLKAAIGIPEDHPYHYPMMIGFSKARYVRLPERKEPRITFK
jgi:nitroreductase/NAD-dependent dihydropyrimidine dehydrogenase PreA subunit